MKYNNKKINAKFYGKVPVIPQEDSPEGYILAPYVLYEQTKIYESDKIKMLESMTDRQNFMKQYKEDHALCPNCGIEGYHTQTLTAFIFYNDRPEEYKDLNRCICMKCKNIHTYHDRTKK